MHYLARKGAHIFRIAGDIAHRTGLDDLDQLRLSGDLFFQPPHLILQGLIGLLRRELRGITRQARLFGMVMFAAFCRLPAKLINLINRITIKKQGSHDDHAQCLQHGQQRKILALRHENGIEQIDLLAHSARLS